MLIFSRRINDTIRIGDDVKITILEIESDSVRVRVDVPQGRIDVLLIVNQPITMYGNIQVMLTSLTRNRPSLQAKIGIEAPREIPVHRGEIYQLLKGKADE